MESEFQKEVLQYLKTISIQLATLNKRVELVEKKTQELGRGCARAFEMCRIVIGNISDNLDEYGGVISESTWV